MWLNKHTYQQNLYKLCYCVIIKTEYQTYLKTHFYQTRSAWSVDQGSNKNHSPAYNFAPTVTKFCVMWEGLSLPHDTKFGNCRCKIVDSRSFPSWSLIHGLRWSGLIKVGPVFFMAMSTLRHAKKCQPNHSGTTEEGNGSYLLPLSHREIVFTHPGRMTHTCICVNKLARHGFRLWHVACLGTNHYLNQYWSIVNWTSLGTGF